MCLKPSNLRPPISFYRCNQQKSKGKKVGYCRLHSLRGVAARSRRRLSSKQVKVKKLAILRTRMEIKNLELYVENKSIIEENEKLRKQACVLQQENQALLSELQMKYSVISNSLSVGVACPTEMKGSLNQQ